jgi:indolepyruvate ferredoxin oxidoreductase
MSYKDEYEVARLYTRPEFAAAMTDAFEGGPGLKLNLAPPFLPLGRDRKTGRPRKIAVGSWIFPVFRLLAKGKRLRRGPLDVFGYSAERRMERALIGEYRDMVLRVAARLTEANLGLATQIAQSAALVRGYGPVKHDGVIAWRAALGDLLTRFEAAPIADTSRAERTPEPA